MEATLFLCLSTIKTTLGNKDTRYKKKLDVLINYDANLVKKNKVELKF